MSMRLRLEAAGEVPFWFIGDPLKNERTEMSLALDESLQYQRNQQSVQGTEWKTQKHYDRKNQRFTVSATVNYKFESDWERMDFTAALANVDPALQPHKWAGNVWLRIDKPGTNEFREWQLVDAVINLTAWVPKGAVGLDLRYTVTCKGFGSAQTGDSVFARLTGNLLPPMVLDIPATEMQALVDDVISGSTVDFPISVEVSLTGGSALVMQRWFLPPGGTPVTGVSFALPIAAGLADFVAAISSTFTSLAISSAGDVLSFIDSAPLTTVSLSVQLKHRYTSGSGGSTVTEVLATWNGTGQLNLLTGTLSGLTYVLTGTHQTLTP